MRHLKIWLLYTKNSFQLTLANHTVAFLLFLGKFLRIGLFLIFLNFLFTGTGSMAGYSRDQIIFFYLSFNVVDTIAQLLFREVYRFRSHVVTGSLDLILTKPAHPLIRVLLGGADLLDTGMLVLLIGAVVWFGTSRISISPLQWTYYIVLVANSLLMAAAFHIFVLGLGIRTTSVDHLVMIYRDLTSLMRIPVDLYREPVRFLLTFLIPIGIMFTFPPKVLMGLLSPLLLGISIIAGCLFFYLSLRYWESSLKTYQSAGG